MTSFTTKLTECRKKANETACTCWASDTLSNAAKTIKDCSSKPLFPSQNDYESNKKLTGSKVADELDLTFESIQNWPKRVETIFSDYNFWKRKL